MTGVQTCALPIYLRSSPSKENLALRKERSDKGSFTVGSKSIEKTISKKDNSSYEINFTVKNINADKLIISLLNSNNERVEIVYDLLNEELSFDRNNSGITDFSDIFPSVTQMPVNSNGETEFIIFIDKASIELFAGDGVMTNIVYPERPYNKINFKTENGKVKVEDLVIYNLKNNK